MTAFLRVNGITVPVADGAAAFGQTEFDAMSRAVDLTPLWSRRGTKRFWKFSTRWKTTAEALAFRDLLTGNGVQALSFETNSLYTKKGLAPASASGGFTVSSSNPKYGTYRAAATAGSTATWAVLSSSSAWSVLLWHTSDGGSTWTHYVVRSDGAKWVAGVRNDAASTTFVGISSGVLTLGNGSANGFDDVVVLPFLVPTDWPAQVVAFGFAFGGNYPRSLTADGLFIEQNTRVEVCARMGEGRVVRASPGTSGTSVQPMLSIGLDLEEV